MKQGCAARVFQQSLGNTFHDEAEAMIAFHFGCKPFVASNAGVEGADCHMIASFKAEYFVT